MDPRAEKNPDFNEILWQLDRLSGASVLNKESTMAATRARYILAEVRKFIETEKKEEEYTEFIKNLLGVFPSTPKERENLFVACKNPPRTII